MTPYDPTAAEGRALLDHHTATPPGGCHSCGAGPTRTWPVPPDQRTAGLPAALRWCARCQPFAGAPLDDWSDA